MEAVIDALAVARLLADPAYSYRENVQLLADMGIEPVIMPKEGAGKLAKGLSGMEAPYLRVHGARCRGMRRDMG